MDPSDKILNQVASKTNLNIDSLTKKNALPPEPPTNHTAIPHESSLTIDLASLKKAIQHAFEKALSVLKIGGLGVAGLGIGAIALTLWLPGTIVGITHTKIREAQGIKLDNFSLIEKGCWLISILPAGLSIMAFKEIRTETKSPLWNPQNKPISLENTDSSKEFHETAANMTVDQEIELEPTGKPFDVPELD